jgi:hypothetical protein
MQFNAPGTYTVETHAGNTRTIEVVERNGELGVWFQMLYRFLPVSEFVGVKIVNKKALHIKQ